MTNEFNKFLTYLQYKILQNKFNFLLSDVAPFSGNNASFRTFHQIKSISFEVIIRK